MTFHPISRPLRTLGAATIAFAATASLAVAQQQPATPEIRMSAANKVPVCVTPDRLMQVLEERNPSLDPRFKGIATLYKQHGEATNVRWDYAFYQMVLETNYLMFKRGSGKPGDVRARQNNFAGLGATGGGVPGESFPDVSTGVLAQLQHLVAYSGEMVADPVGKRTKEVQDGVVAQSKKLGRAVRFADLTNRWAHDRNYARSIDSVAERFKSAACNGVQSTPVAEVPKGKAVVAAETPAAPVAKEQKAVASAKVKAPVEAPVVQAPAAEPVAAEPAATAETKASRRKGRDLAKQAMEQPAEAAAAPKSGLGAVNVTAAKCSVMAASFGGSVTLLIRAKDGESVRFTALDVDATSEQSMTDSYMATHAPGGVVTGRFKTRDEAVAAAYARCDSGAP